jgi:iron-sulfur cluster repair protein YtfE (RIC family)
MDLAPSVVRKIILQEHAELRSKLQEMEDAIRSKEFTKLRNLLLEFNTYFIRHIKTEEAILRPVLKDIDAWGSVRIERMNSEHADQKNEIKEIDQLVASHRPKDYLPQLESFIAKIKRDIEDEEKDCLDPDVMKDDPITSGTMGG